MRRTFAGVLMGLGILPAPLLAQGFGVGAARWLTGPHVSEYRIGMGGYAFGPLSLRPSIQYLRQAGISRAAWGGVGGDVILRTTPNALPYLIGGGAVGLGRAATGGIGPGIGAWGGVGAELFAFEGFGLQAEALYTWRSKMGVQSVSLGLRIGTQIGRRQAGVDKAAIATASAVPIPVASAKDEATLRSATRASGVTTSNSAIVSTALSVMGTPYRWGGTSTDGFDCSGLIQYAYAEQGISLPRRSAEQAHVGKEVGREMADLLPGDILTFAAEPGGEVSHVGLYLGEGRFIHSATGGVQTSVLSPSDAAGKWWWERWLGTRRVLEH